MVKKIGKECILRTEGNQTITLISMQSQNLAEKLDDKVTQKAGDAAKAKVAQHQLAKQAKKGVCTVLCLLFLPWLSGAKLSSRWRN